MRRPEDRHTELDMLTAAFLAAEGVKQIAIADTLAISQAAVSRLLAQARQTHLRQELRFLEDKVSPDVMEQIRRRVSRRPRSEALNRISLHFARVRGPSLRVFPCTAPPGDMPQRMTELSRLAARTIRELILRCRCFGVTWGGMVSRVAAAMKELALPAPWVEDPIEVIPLSGEPLGDSPTTYSSSSIAHLLGQVLNGESYNARSLAMVPAFVPDRFEPEEIAGVWRLIGLVKSHAEIFGPHRDGAHPKGQGAAEQGPIAGRVDMILTSVGPAERPLGFGKGTLFATGKVTIEDLRQLVLGDMGGVCFPKPTLTAKQAARLEAVAGRWTGLTKEHLVPCAQRAFAQHSSSKGPPGVVVISVGRERAPFLLEAIKLGLINHLIIDDELQDELERIVKHDFPGFISESSPAAGRR